MDRWWIDGWMDWFDGWIDEWMNEWVNEWMDGLPRTHSTELTNIVWLTGNSIKSLDWRDADNAINYNKKTITSHYHNNTI